MLLQDLPSHSRTGCVLLHPAALPTQTEVDGPLLRAGTPPAQLPGQQIDMSWVLVGALASPRKVFSRHSTGSGIVSACPVGPPCYGAGRVPSGPGTTQAGTGWKLAHSEAALVVQRNEAAQGSPPGAGLGLEPRPWTPGPRSPSRSPGCSPVVPSCSKYHEGISRASGAPPPPQVS